MIKPLKQIDISKVMFFDIETVAGQETIDPTKDEVLFNAAAWKYRDHQTGKEQPAEEVVKTFEKQAALHPPYGKIACISMGYIHEGELRVKTLSDDEEQIIRDFYKMSQGRVLIGYNSNRFDLSYIRLRGWKYGIEVPSALDSFEKKPWDATTQAVLQGTCMYLDIMDVVRQLFMKNLSLEDCCILFNIPTPKEDLKGSDVSYVYYNVEGGLEKIITYCELDVLTVANLFLYLRGETLIDFSEDCQPPKSLTLVERIYQSKEFTQENKDELREKLDKEKLTKVDKMNLGKFLLALLDSSVGFTKDKSLAEKEEMINEFIKTL